MCVACIWVCRWTHCYMRTCRGKNMTAGVFLGHFTNSETGFLTEPQAHYFGKLASQRALEICQSLLPDAGIIGTRSHAQLFYLGVEYSNSGITLAKQVYYPLSPLPNPSLISVSRNWSSWIFHCRLEATFQEFQHVPDLASALSSPDCLLLSFKFYFESLMSLSWNASHHCWVWGFIFLVNVTGFEIIWKIHLWVCLEKCSPWEGETHAGGIIPGSDVPD